MKRLFVVAIVGAFLLSTLALEGHTAQINKISTVITAAGAKPYLRIYISGNCNRVGIAGWVNGDVLVDGSLKASKVLSAGVEVSPGSHVIQVNGYCMDKNKTARDLGSQQKNCQIKDGETKDFRFVF